MALGSPDSGVGSSPLTRSSAQLAALVEAYQNMEMAIGRYVLLVLVPALVFFAGSTAAAVAAPLPLLIRAPLAMLGALMVGAAAVFPKLQFESRKRGLENQLHLFITHITILSTTNINRVEVFRHLATEQEYGEIAAEMGRVVRLVDTWNRSLNEATKRRAKAVPSKPFADLLDRLSYSLESGQELGDFLLDEQDAIIQEYVTIYESTLGNLEVMRDLYLSMILSMTFAVVNSVILPILVGVDAASTVAAVIVLFVFVQLGFYYVIRVISPYDPLWYHTDQYRTEASRRMGVALAVGVVLVALLTPVVLLSHYGIAMPRPLVSFFSSLDVPLLFAIPITPLLLPALVARQAENKVKNKDEEYPGFIRALGSAESAKQSTTSAVLSDLHEKDFGDLTADIDALYTRLNMRIDPERAWEYFSSESGSYLIQKFNNMYQTGRQMGGDPKLLAELISKNMHTVMQLRQQRKQSTITLIGVLYGITASATFSLFIAYEVVEILSGLAVDMELGQRLPVGQLLYSGVYDLPLIQFELSLILLFNAALSALMIREVDGGHKNNAYLHFVALTWTGCLIASLTIHIVSQLLAV
ncbi:MAG: archaellar assembly protein FlaJ [Halorientalis sp.]